MKKVSVVCLFRAGVSCRLALRDAQFRMRITLRVVPIHSLVSAGKALNWRVRKKVVQTGQRA